MSKNTREVEGLVPVKNCIRFWEGMLLSSKAFLPISTVVIIETTIKYLKGVIEVV